MTRAIGHGIQEAEQALLDELRKVLVHRVHPQLTAYLADAQVLPLAGETLQDGQGPVHGVYDVGVEPSTR